MGLFNFSKKTVAEPKPNNTPIIQRIPGETARESTDESSLGISENPSLTSFPKPVAIPKRKVKRRKITPPESSINSEASFFSFPRLPESPSVSRRSSISSFINPPTTAENEYVDRMEREVDGLENNETDSVLPIADVSPAVSAENSILSGTNKVVIPKRKARKKATTVIPKPTELITEEGFELLDEKELEETGEFEFINREPEPVRCAADSSLPPTIATPFKAITRRPKRTKEELKSVMKEGKQILQSNNVIEGYEDSGTLRLTYLMGIQNDLKITMESYGEINSLVDFEDSYLKLIKHTEDSKTVIDGTSNSVLADLGMEQTQEDEDTSLYDRLPPAIKDKLSKYVDDIKLVLGSLQKVKKSIGIVYDLMDADKKKVDEARKLLLKLRELAYDITQMNKIVEKYTKDTTISQYIPGLNIFISLAVILDTILKTTKNCMSYSDMSYYLTSIKDDFRGDSSLSGLMEMDGTVNHQNKLKLHEMAFKSSMIRTKAGSFSSDNYGPNSFLFGAELVTKNDYHNVTDTEKLARKYDVGLELRYINKKRALRSLTNLVQEIPDLIANIAMITGAGTKIGLMLKGANYINKKIIPGVRNTKQYLRDSGYITPNGKTTNDKHYHRVSIIKEILQQIMNLSPENGKQKLVKQANEISGFIQASGANEKTLFEADSPQVRIWYLYKKLLSRNTL